jgi:6-pyruvoyltetrahydropterin/6-carboxytetrahydropterin synthase
MFEVGVVGHFDAHHHLEGDFGPASLPHGHRYRIEASVQGPGLRPDGTLFDITRLQAALRTVAKELDGRNLNDLPLASLANPTAEVVARYAFDCMAATLAGLGLIGLEVRVWESDDAFAGYTGDLG